MNTEQPKAAVTPAMIEAGTMALMERELGEASQDDVVTLIYRAMLAAAPVPMEEPLASIDAVRQVMSFRAGNTQLLRLLMEMVSHYVCGNNKQYAPFVMPGWRPPCVVEAVRTLVTAGCARELDAGGNEVHLLWEVVEARVDKPMTWEQAVRQCITDPAEIERLLALDDEPDLAKASDSEGGEPS